MAANPSIFFESPPISDEAQLIFTPSSALPELASLNKQTMKPAEDMYLFTSAMQCDVRRYVLQQFV
jgi:hypothetical protein